MLFVAAAAADLIERHLVRTLRVKVPNDQVLDSLHGSCALQPRTRGAGSAVFLVTDRPMDALISNHFAESHRASSSLTLTAGTVPLVETLTAPAPNRSAPAQWILMVPSAIART